MSLEPEEVDSLRQHDDQTALYERHGKAIFGYLRLHLRSLEDTEDLLLEKLTVNTLLEKGVLQFWDTGPTEVNVGATFDPGQYTPYNPGGKPRFTGRDLDPQSLAVTEDQTGQSVVDFSMEGDAIRRFQLYTTTNVGHYLTITLDGKVQESAVIQSAIDGQGQITGNFTQQQARAIVAALRYGSLPVELKQQG